MEHKVDMSVYLTAPLQLDKICRACLTEKGDMRPLFGACLDEMLHSFASVQVKNEQALPSRLPFLSNLCRDGVIEKEMEECLMCGGDYY